MPQFYDPNSTIGELKERIYKLYSNGAVKNRLLQGHSPSKGIYSIVGTLVRLSREQGHISQLKLDLDNPILTSNQLFYASVLGSVLAKGEKLLNNLEFRKFNLLAIKYTAQLLNHRNNLVYQDSFRSDLQSVMKNQLTELIQDNQELTTQEFQILRNGLPNCRVLLDLVFECAQEEYITKQGSLPLQHPVLPPSPLTNQMPDIRRPAPQVTSTPVGLSEPGRLSEQNRFFRPEPSFESLMSTAMSLFPISLNNHFELRRVCQQIILHFPIPAVNSIQNEQFANSYPLVSATLAKCMALTPTLSVEISTRLHSLSAYRYCLALPNMSDPQSGNDLTNYLYNKEARESIRAFVCREPVVARERYISPETQMNQNYLTLIREECAMILQRVLDTNQEPTAYSGFSPR